MSEPETMPAKGKRRPREDPISPLRDIEERWISGHLYYHENLDTAVRRFVHPLVVSLLRDRMIDRFFFLRYGLGGFHVRLRLRVVPGVRQSVLETMEHSARGFLDREPSTRPLQADVVRRWNESILAADPNERDDTVYPDNSFHVAPFRPEFERYGGVDRLRSSLDFFTLSSVAVLEHLQEYGDHARSARLSQAFRLLLQQALGFATDTAELADLLRYGTDAWGEEMPKIIEKANRVARVRKDAFFQLFKKSYAPSSRVTEVLIAGSSALSAAIGVDRVERARIGGSQLHMTASRLGLNNAEEVYLSRLLVFTLRELDAGGESEMPCTEQDRAKRASYESSSFADLVPLALTILAADRSG